MLRARLNDSLKAAMLAKDARTVSTVRLILAALKDRDIAGRTKGQTDGISDDEILQMLQSMMKQRRESIALYEQGGRLELAQQEAEEIEIIERFLPKQLTDEELAHSVADTIAELGAGGLKDMGRVMATLRERFAGRMDFAKASAVAKRQLGADRLGRRRWRSPAVPRRTEGRLSLASVIGRRVRLTRRGREYTGLCPFHNEKTPSFTVNEEKGFFHCFGCGAHGDVVGFEMRAANLSFPEAVERLAAEAGVVPPQESREERERSRRQASLYDVVEAACVWFERQLRQPVGRAALAYLQGRGLDDDAIARFRLGFAPDGRSGLAEALRAQGIPHELMLEAGLLIDPDRGDPYDRFRGGSCSRSATAEAG